MTGAPLQIAATYRSPWLCKTCKSKRPWSVSDEDGGAGRSALAPTPLPRAGEGLTADRSGRTHFSPASIAVARLPVASSPLNSQKNAPPRFCALTYCIFSLISCGVS